MLNHIWYQDRCTARKREMKPCVTFVILVKGKTDAGILIPSHNYLRITNGSSQLCN